MDLNLLDVVALSVSGRYLLEPNLLSPITLNTYCVPSSKPVTTYFVAFPVSSYLEGK